MPSPPTPKPAAFSVKCEHCGAGSLSPDAGVLRCACGSLLARYVDGALELKCRRCKRIVLLPLSVEAAHD